MIEKYKKIELIFPKNLPTFSPLPTTPGSRSQARTSRPWILSGMHQFLPRLFSPFCASNSTDLDVNGKGNSSAYDKMTCHETYCEAKI
jgi:hypothetical protein